MTQKQTILSPQALRIYEILKDGAWHCPIDWEYADGHTKRITDINNYLKPLGQQIESQWCDCGRHTAKIKKRRIVDTIKPIYQSEYIAKQFLQEFGTKEKVKEHTLF